MDITNRQTIINKLKNKEPLTIDEDLYLEGNPLTDIEAFTIIEDDPYKIEQYTKFYNLRASANKGNLTKEELQFLCDTAFGDATFDGNARCSDLVYNQMLINGCVKDDEEHLNTPKIM